MYLQVQNHQQWLEPQEDGQKAGSRLFLTAAKGSQFVDILIQNSSL